MKEQFKVEIPRKDRPYLDVYTNLEEREKIQSYMDNYDWVTDTSEKFNDPSVCCICGQPSNKTYKSKSFCNRHISQLYRHGEIVSIHRRTPNEIQFKKNYAELITRSNSGDTITGTAKIDPIFIPSIIESKWGRSSSGYFESRINGKLVLLHRFIMKVNDKFTIVDHKNLDKSDNRVANLRITTSKGNAQNKGLSKYNKSGYTGVYTEEYHGKPRYRAFINMGVKITLGTYNSLEEALISRLIAEYTLCEKGFAPQRHLFDKYNISEKAKGLSVEYFMNKGEPKYEVRGVSYNKSRDNYGVDLSYKGKKIIGTSKKTLHEAQVARLQAEVDHLPKGHKSRQEHLYEKFGIESK